VLFLLNKKDFINMNLPVTNPIVKNVFLEQIIPEKLFLDLQEKKFIGYLYLVVDGKYGFEESIIVLSKGAVTGAIFLIEPYEIELYGKEAITYCINSYGHKLGQFDIFELTDDQIKLILLFNDKIKFNYPINNKKGNYFEKIKYDQNKIDLLVKDKITIDKTKKEILDERGLEELLK